jgi:hypothetical protein
MRFCSALLLGIWMVCLSASGGYLTETNWVVNPSESGTSWSTWSTVLANDELLAVGFEDSTGFARPRVMRIDTNGVVQFDHAYNTPLMTNYSIRAIYAGVLANSNVFVGCTAEASGGGSGAFFMTLNTNGSSIVTQSLVSASPMRYMLNTNDEVLVVGDDVRLYTTNGAFIKSGNLTTGGSPVGRSVNQTADGGYIVSGNTGNTPSSAYYALLSRFDSDLNLLWSQRYYDTNGAQIAYCAVENPDGTFTACGSEEGGSNDKRLLFKTDDAGNRLWVKTEWAGAYGGWNTLVPTADGGSIAVGISFNNDLTVGSDANGEYLWGYSFYAEGSLRGIIPVSTNQYLLSGQNGSTMHAGGGDWLVYNLQVDFNRDIVVTSILPFEPNESNGWSLATCTGVTNHFAFSGYDPDGVPLTYSWAMPNQQEEWIELSTNATCDLILPPEAAGTWKMLMLSVSDGFNQLFYEWGIEVSNRATVITQILPFEPSEGNSDVTVRVGETEQFQFDGYDPDGNELQYLWELDGHEVSTTNLFSFSPSVAESIHTLTLKVTVIPDVEESVYTWQITVPALYAPYEASAVSPWDGETGVSAGKTPALSWSFNEDEDHPVEWSAVFFSTNQHSVTWLFPDAEVLNDGNTLATNYIAPAQLEYEKTYYWRIVGHNAVGVSTSAVFSFTTGALPQPPYEPNALSPWDGSTGVRIDSAVQWGFSYDAGHPADSSDLYFSADSNLVSSLNASVRVVSGGPADGNYPPPANLIPGQTYYWRVVGHNTAGSTTGPVWSFTAENILSLPYEQGFDSGLPEGWRTLMNGWNGGGLEGDHLEQDWSGWNTVWDEALIRSGSGAVGMNGGMPALHWLESPLFTAATNTELSAWIYYGPDEWENPAAPLHLLVKADGIWNTVRTWTVNETNRYQTPITVPLTAYAGKTVRIAWVYDLTGSGAAVALDDLLIQNGSSAAETNFTLTVIHGTGSGSYPEHAVIDIVADAAPAGQKFSAWTGSTGYVANILSAATTVSMPALPITLTATYVERDTDGDGMDDDWETTYLGGLKPNGAQDSDGDGKTDLEEFIAGTHPGDKGSVFEISDFRAGPPSVINWSSVSGRVYSVYWSTNLISGFQCLESNIPYTRTGFTNSGSLRGFYRISVQLDTP